MKVSDHIFTSGYIAIWLLMIMFAGSCGRDQNREHEVQDNLDLTVTPIQEDEPSGITDNGWQRGDTLPGKTDVSSQWRALLIGISDYDELKTGWHPIHGARDAEVLKRVLIGRGFEPSNISLLEQERCTKEGIEKAFKDLLERSGKGDLVFIQISSHGQQVRDDNGDELDGYDEAFIPLDAMRTLNFNGSGYKGEKHIRDDEISGWLLNLRRKLGPNGRVVFVADACHSGTSTRGLNYTRGSAKSLEGDYSDTKDHLPDFKVDRKEENSLAGFVNLNATRPGEANFETLNDQGESMGSLTYALGKVLAEPDLSTTWKEVYTRVALIMGSISPRQSPMIEGDISLPVFGSSGRMGEEVFEIIHRSGRIISIGAGEINGITSGSRVELIEVSGKKRKEALTQGEVIEAGYLLSTIRLERELTDEEALSAEVHILKRSYGHMRIRIALSGNLPESIRTLDQELEKSPYVEIVAPESIYQLLVERCNGGGDSLNIVDRNGHALGGCLSPADLICYLEEYARSMALKRLEAEEKGIGLELELIPIVRQGITIGVNDTLNPSGGTDILAFHPGDEFRVLLTNNSDKSVYISLLDLQPDGRINCLVPEEGFVQEEYKLAPKESAYFPRNYPSWVIGPPYGREMLKLLASREPIDFCEILTECSQGKSRGFQDTNLTVMDLIESDPGTTSRGGFSRTPSTGFTATSYLFDISPGPEIGF